MSGVVRYGCRAVQIGASDRFVLTAACALQPSPPAPTWGRDVCAQAAEEDQHARAMTNRSTQAPLDSQKRCLIFDDDAASCAHGANKQEALRPLTG